MVPARTAALLVVLLACESKPDNHDPQAAQAEFTKEFSCPAASVTVTARPDLSAYDLQVDPIAPPREVAANPARLAEWKKHQEDTREGYKSEHVLRASGCGHTVYYVCTLATGTNEQAVTACTLARHPPKEH
jgi:hypothetical protein